MIDYTVAFAFPPDIPLSDFAMLSALKFKFFACLCYFQFFKFLADSLGHHIIYMIVNIFDMPCGQIFYTYFKNWARGFWPLTQ